MALLLGKTYSGERFRAILALLFLFWSTNSFLFVKEKVYTLCFRTNLRDKNRMLANFYATFIFFKRECHGIAASPEHCMVVSLSFWVSVTSLVSVCPSMEESFAHSTGVNIGNVLPDPASNDL